MVKFNDFIAETNFRGEKFNKAIDLVVKSGRYILGKEVENFEKQFADYLSVKYCIGVANGLEAIQISLMALGIGEKDEVITTPLSAVATTLAILAVKAKPVFVDTREDGLINPDLLIKKIGKNTKAILPVHLYGQPVDLERIEWICRKYHLCLVEDACQAHGSTYNNRKLGTFGKLGCFSFYPTKNLGALGDGGAIVTNNTRLAAFCREIRDYGQSKKYLHRVYGLNSRLDEIQAAILSVKLPYLDRDNRKRKKFAERYIKKLSPLKLDIVTKNENGGSNFHLFVIRTKKRRELASFLSQKQIPTLIHFPRIIPEQPFLASKFKNQNLTVARTLADQVLSLPCHPYMKNEEVDFVCQKISDFLRRPAS